MESIAQLVIDNAPYAHYIIFGTLILAGLNFPISEDLMIILSAIIAANIIPENTILLFACVFLGCYLSDWISYWLGRTLGRKLWEIKWFSKTIKKKRLVQAQRFYQKYGISTLLVGRFIPFGVRNCLFITAGMSRMHFGKFLIGDGIACILSNSLLFWLAYTLGKNYQALMKYVKTFNISLFTVFVVTIISFFWYKNRKNKVKE